MTDELENNRRRLNSILQNVPRSSEPSPPPGTDAIRFTLVELLVLMACAAIAFALIAQGLNGLGISFLLTVVAFRTSLVDFTPIGNLAVLLTIVFGTTSIALLIFWSVGL